LFREIGEEVGEELAAAALGAQQYGQCDELGC
jgi:hypothetical protein